MNKSEMLAKIADCKKCSGITRFRKENDYWTVPGEGCAGAKVVFLGEAPGETEAQTGSPYGCLSGDMLEDMLDGRRVICTYHPKYLSRKPEAHAETWKDLQMLVNDIAALQTA